MATKKQRRRREKLQRHEYEYVVEDDEGQEVVVEAPKPTSTSSSTSKPKGRPDGAVVDARGRVMKPPSWGRVLKRSAIFAPILLALVFFTGRELSTNAKILNVVILLLIFLPFSYLVDLLIYRSVKRRQQKSAGS